MARSFYGLSEVLFVMVGKNYYRIMLGQKSKYAQECIDGGFIGTDFNIAVDLTDKLPDDRRDFREICAPAYFEVNPDKSKVAAGLACGTIYTASKGILDGDIVLCPDGGGSYLVGEITGSYFYQADQILPHRRPVTWYPKRIARSEMSESLRNSTGSIGTLSNISKHQDEIETLLSGNAPSPLGFTDPTIEDPSVFALEKHLEDFLVKNWQQTALAERYDIFEEDGDLVGQQYPTETGPIDILAVSKDKKELLVVELKKGRASDAVVGQIQRYMGFVLEDLAEEGQEVRGIIIALDDDPKLRYALKVASNMNRPRSTRHSPRSW
jgi:restriction system protein